MTRLRACASLALLFCSACGLIRASGDPVAAPAPTSRRAPSAPEENVSRTEPATTASAPTEDPSARAKTLLEEQVKRKLDCLKSGTTLCGFTADWELARYREQLATEVATLDDIFVNPLIEQVHERAQQALTGGAEKHAGWGDTTAAPPAAAAVAIEKLKTHPYLARDKDQFTFLAVRVVSKDWLVERSTAGIPRAKFKRVKVVVKRAGLEGCMAFDATINHANLGGSTYAAAWGAVAEPSSLVGVKCP